MKKKMAIYGLIIFSIGLIAGYIINLKGGEQLVADSKRISSAESNVDNHEQIVSGYSIETTEKNIIDKEFDGTYLDSFVTVAKQQDEFALNVTGIDSTSEVFMINPVTGDMEPLQYNDGVFSLKTTIEKDINYGIIMDYKLVGSIRAVEDLNAIDKDKLFNEILISLGCGL